MGYALLRSMTGFGKAQVEAGNVVIDVELRTLNHRFLDFTLRVPPAYAQFELDIRSAVAARLERGKIEVLIGRRVHGGQAVQPVLDEQLFQRYLDLYKRVGASIGLREEVIQERAVLEILSRKEVLAPVEEVADFETERDPLFRSLALALARLCEMRECEGVKLLADVTGRLEQLRSIRARICALTETTGQRHRERLFTRIQKLTPEIKVDESRLAQEVAFILDRLDVTEELTRLESHFHQFGEILKDPPNGRKLEFLLQELGREFNTISSKCQDAQIQALTIEAKATLEKMREQIHNVE
jgi:uncharacterized protein (TIGR00255 family)